MDDLISRQAAIDAINEECDNLEKMRGGIVYAQGLRGAIPILDTIPTAEPEIIRCKDCKHWLDIDDGRQKHRMCADVYGDWFCADAERRIDGVDR